MVVSPSPARSSGLLLTLGLVAGCGTLDCTTDARPAVLVTVLDAATGQTVRGDLRVIASDGLVADTVDTEGWLFPEPVDRDTVDFGPFPLAWERAGVYSVAVEAPAYHPWEEGGIRVGRDRCHVRTVPVEARLEAEQP